MSPAPAARTSRSRITHCRPPRPTHSTCSSGYDAERRSSTCTSRILTERQHQHGRRIWPSGACVVTRPIRASSVRAVAPLVKSTTAGMPAPPIRLSPTGCDAAGPAPSWPQRGQGLSAEFNRRPRFPSKYSRQRGSAAEQAIEPWLVPGSQRAARRALPQRRWMDRAPSRVGRESCDHPYSKTGSAAIFTVAGGVTTTSSAPYRARQI